jgi:hypothetical protein
VDAFFDSTAINGAFNLRQSRKFAAGRLDRMLQVNLLLWLWLLFHKRFGLTISVKVDARVALLKDFNVEDEISYRDYKKFSSASKVVPLGEVGTQK